MRLNHRNTALAWREKSNDEGSFHSKRSEHMSIEIAGAGIRTLEDKTSDRCAE